MSTSEAENSGKSGALKPNNHLPPSSTVNLPDEPTIPQRVKFFDAGVTFIADLLPIEHIEAIKFDEWIMQFFSSIQEIDREKWELADKLWAVNSVLSQQKQRREKGQPYLRRDELEGKGYIITAIYPNTTQEDNS